MQAEHVFPSQNILGEGPLWNVKEQALYWVDIEGKKIQRYIPATETYKAFDVPIRIGMIAFRQQGGLVCGTENGFYFWEIGAKEMEFIIHPEKGKQEARFNDGKVDRRGRLWAGTMTAKGASSALYRLDPDLNIRKMLDQVTISNGIGWSPDNKTMYYVDSNRFVINAFDFDDQSGTFSNQRPFVQLDGDNGVPDGLTVDSEGHVWCAIYDGWKVMRYAPTGEVSAQIRMPVSKPSSCIFGGENFDELYITTISDGLTTEEKENEPMAGDLFMVKTDTKGIPESFFAG